jgi:TolB-like protein/DNA-binding winged helix-turn-helix (wHTH) protein/Flp pilus assembly protein TadD
VPDVLGYRFGDFELDVRSGELRRRGLKVHLQEQPFQLLRVLLDQPGQVVTREELERRLWPTHDLVASDRGLNNAVRRLREALLDDAAAPRFVETVARQGYRFMAPVEPIERGPAAPEPPPTSGPEPRKGRVAVRLAAVLLAAAAVVAGILAARGRRHEPPPGKLMLAVLPFDNLSGDPEQDYFSDGLTEEMIAQLSMVQPESMRVIARTSAMQYKGTRKKADQIGRELGVHYLLEGSVRRSAGRVRITVQLVEAPTQAHRWSQSYERDLQDVLSLQKEVAEAVAGAVRLELSPQVRARLALRSSVHPEAYVAYLKGRHSWNRRTRESLEQAIVFFSEAATADASWSAPQSGLADAHVFLAWYAHRAPLDVLPRAKQAAEAAVARDPASVEAHASLALVRYLFDWDFTSAQEEFARALRSNPNHAYARYWHGYFLLAMQRHDEALREVEAALELDPLSTGIGTGLAYAYIVAHQPGEAVAQCRRVLELEPDYYLAHKMMGWALEDQGRYDEALAAFDRDQAASGIDTDFERAHAHALAGRVREARALLARYERSSASRYVSIGNRARVYVLLGDKDKTLDLLEQAYRDRSVNLVTPRFRNEFRPLAGDPRFQDLVRRVGLPPPDTRSPKAKAASELPL